MKRLLLLGFLVPGMAIAGVDETRVVECATEFSIMLPVSPGIGKAWKVAISDDKLVEDIGYTIGQTDPLVGGEPRSLGGPAQANFHFRSVNHLSGTATITFTKYYRGKKTDETYTVNVIVRPGVCQEPF
jgi:hypothetical protein